MPIFISYSHENSGFVDRLAHQLVRARVYVWLDRWELHVGDSIISRIQDAITKASALLVILSEASVNSPWCQKELNSGLLRELEERRVVVLPVLIEDCQIPLFLRDKLYADFRTDFDSGLRTILEATAGIANPATGRINEPEYHSDWALDWGELDGDAHFRLTIIQEAVGQPFTVLSTVEITADTRGTRDYHARVRVDGEEKANTGVVSIVADYLHRSGGLVLRLGDQFEQVRSYNWAEGKATYSVRVSARRLGMDNGRDVLFDLGSHLRELVRHMNDVLTNASAKS